MCRNIALVHLLFSPRKQKKTLLSMHNWNVLLHLRKSQETFLHFFCFDAKIFLTSLTFLLQIRVCSPPPLPLLHRPEHEINRNNGVRMFFCFAYPLAHTRAHIHCSHHSRAYGRIGNDFSCDFSTLFFSAVDPLAFVVVFVLLQFVSVFACASFSLCPCALPCWARWDVYAKRSSRKQHTNGVVFGGEGLAVRKSAACWPSYGHTLCNAQQ